MDSEEYLELLAYDIAFSFATLRSPNVTLEQLGEVSETVIPKLRAAAIIALLAKGDPDLYYHNLMRAVRCRLQYLQQCMSRGRTSEHHQASSRLNGFLAAVAAVDFLTARQIISLSPVTWLEGHEYEDDYCFAQILHGLLAARADNERLQQLLDRFDRVLEGKPDARLELVKAIVARDQTAFDVALDGFIAARTAQLEEDEARHRIVEPVMMAERQIYIDGLALLQIAERLGFSLQPEYLYLPSLARVPMQKPFPGE